MEGGHNQSRQHHGNFFHQPRLPYYQIKPNYYKPHHRQHGHRDHGPTNATTFDTKRLKNNLLRRTVDYNASIIRYLQTRVWQRDYRDTRWIQPDFAYVGDLNLPHALLDNPINAVTTRFVRTSTNKVRCPIFCVVWTPEGRRLVTGASSGEFTLWNGLTFNFETILQAHEYAVRTMTWSHNDMWLLTGDDLGYVKYWQSNMNNVQMYQAHKNQAVRCARYYTTTSSLLDLMHTIAENLICSFVTREKYTEICHFASVDDILCLSIVLTVCLAAWIMELCQVYFRCTTFQHYIVSVVMLCMLNDVEGRYGTLPKAVNVCLENIACNLTCYLCYILTVAEIITISPVRLKPLTFENLNKTLSGVRVVSDESSNLLLDYPVV